MKAKDIISLLEANPEADLILWDGEENWEMTNVELDAINNSEIVFEAQTSVTNKKLTS